MPAAVRTTLGELSRESADSVIGALIAARADEGFSVQYLKQVDTWREQLRILQQFGKELLALQPDSPFWSLLLEYWIPRRNKCLDAVLLAEDLIFVIEFKVGASTFTATDRWQTEDYALDLRDFHLESHDRLLLPVLVATGADSSEPMERLTGTSFVWPLACVSPRDFAARVADLFSAAHLPTRAPIDPESWNRSEYRPALSIIEAATQLFAGHSVREISHAYADNLSRTTDALVKAVRTAQEKRVRTICFVTGVPGAGKTLTGLDAVHSPDALRTEQFPAVFLSGNGPLVRIVRAALVRDAVEKRKVSKKEATRRVSTFVQNVHGYLNEYTKNSPEAPPSERVVVFDEAQRAWSKEQVKKKRGVDCSEPGLMIEIMERCPDWCAIVALVGGGQEIHQGEAGLEEWGRALGEAKREWQVHVSPEALSGGSGLAGHCLFTGPLPSQCRVLEQPSLHLEVSLRSFRAQMLAEWVNFLLQGNAQSAREVLRAVFDFPLVLTRDLGRARHWLRERTRLERRCGLVVSSGSLRHRAYGLEVSSGFRKGYPFEEWFLATAQDVRSSCQLEVAATEFECQGLELDWVGVAWGDDFCMDPGTGTWRYRAFRGNRWQSVKDPAKCQYLRNKYRVLLTRAREGMVIWVPPGDSEDLTRDPILADNTARFLTEAGVPSLE